MEESTKRSHHVNAADLLAVGLALVCGLRLKFQLSVSCLEAPFLSYSACTASSLLTGKRIFGAKGS